MLGLMIIIGIILYLYIAYKVTFYIVDKTPKKRYWVISILFFILLPTLDVIIGKVYFNCLCKTHSGFKVYKSVNVEGFFNKERLFFNKGGIFKSDDEIYKKQGFKFVEGSKYFPYGEYKGKTMFQYVNLTDNNITIQITDKLKSEYEFVYNETKNPVKWLPIVQNRAVVKHIKTGEVLSESIGFKYCGSMVGIILDSLVSGVSNPTQQCKYNPYKLLEQTLKTNTINKESNNGK